MRTSSSVLPSLRGRRKIDLITLNVKLTLRGRGGGDLGSTLGKNGEKPMKR